MAFPQPPVNGRFQEKALAYQISPQLHSRAFVPWSGAQHNIGITSSQEKARKSGRSCSHTLSLSDTRIEAQGRAKLYTSGGPKPTHAYGLSRFEAPVALEASTGGE